MTHSRFKERKISRSCVEREAQGESPSTKGKQKEGELYY